MENIELLNTIKNKLLDSAIHCPVCKSSVKQVDDGCICNSCGVRIERNKYPMKIIDRQCYAIVLLGDAGVKYAIDPVGRTYRIQLQSKTAYYTSDTGHDYESNYTEEVLEWVGLIKDFWNESLW